MQYTTLSREVTEKLYDLCLKMIELAEEVTPDFSEKGDDRMSLVLSPTMAAMFVQAKHRYRPARAQTILVAANMLQNFARADELGALDLADATYQFISMMSEMGGPDGQG